MNVLICGDRNWTDGNMIYDRLVELLETYQPSDVWVIEGEARGADLLARQAAEQLGIHVRPFPAEWEKFGRGAGPVRNRRMLEIGKPDIVWAFHDDIEHSKGTANMVQISRKARVPVVLFKHDERQRDHEHELPTEEVEL